MLGTLEACPIEIMPLIIELELTNFNRASAMQDSYSILCWGR